MPKNSDKNALSIDIPNGPTKEIPTVAHNTNYMIIYKKNLWSNFYREVLGKVSERITRVTPQKKNTLTHNPKT